MSEPRTQHLLDLETGDTTPFRVKSIKGKFKSLKQQLREAKQKIRSEAASSGTAAANKPPAATPDGDSKK